MWIILALTAAATLAVVNLTDKRLLDHHLPGLSTLYLWVALGLVVYIVGAVAIFGIPRDASPAIVLVALASGFSLGAGYALLFVGLKVAEASRAVAISQIYPIFVAFLAVFFLGEKLIPLQWAAITLVVLGTMLVSLPAIPKRLAELKPSRGAPALLGSGLLLGAGFFAAKVALEESSFPTVFIYQQIGALAVFLPFGRPRVWGQLFGAMRSRQTVLLLVVGEGLLAAGRGSWGAASGQPGAYLPGVRFSGHYALLCIRPGYPAEPGSLAGNGGSHNPASPDPEVCGYCNDSSGGRGVGLLLIRN